MSDNKKYYYIKVKDTYFERDNVKILESQENGYTYSLIILKLCLKSAKYDGCLMMTDRIPYSPEKLDILAKIINHDVAHVREAIKMASELDIISIVGSEEIWMTDIQDMIGTSSTEGDRKKKYRKKLKERENGTFVHQINGTSVQEEQEHCPNMGHLSTRDKSIEYRDRYKSIEIEEKNTKKEKPNYQTAESFNPLKKSLDDIIKYWNTKENLPKCLYNSFNVPMVCDIKTKLDVFRNGEIEQAIDNFSTYYSKVDPRFRPKNFQNFITKSLDNWFDDCIDVSMFSDKKSREVGVINPEDIEDLF